MKYYVYVYKTPVAVKIKNMTILPGATFYVGKGCNLRSKKHLREDKIKTSNELKVTVIERIRATNTEPIIDIVKTGLTESEAFDIEKQMISEIGRIIDLTGTLTNLTYGGEGSSGYKHTIETCNILSEKRKGKAPYNKGLKRPGIGGRPVGSSWSQTERESHMQARSRPGYYEYTKDPVRNKKIGDRHKGKIGAAAGKFWFNNGQTELYADDCPDGYIKGRIPRLLTSKLGMLWFNNGVMNKQFKQGMNPEDFVRGRIKKQ